MVWRPPASRKLGPPPPHSYSRIRRTQRGSGCKAAAAPPPLLPTRAGGRGARAAVWGSWRRAPCRLRPPRCPHRVYPAPSPSSWIDARLAAASGCGGHLCSGKRRTPVGAPLGALLSSSVVVFLWSSRTGSLPIFRWLPSEGGSVHSTGACTSSSVASSPPVISLSVPDPPNSRQRPVCGPIGLSHSTSRRPFPPFRLTPRPWPNLQNAVPSGAAAAAAATSRTTAGK